MRPFSITLLLAGLIALTPGFSQESTAFTYQGQLQHSGSPHAGAVEMTFSLWDSEVNGLQLGTTTETVQISDGLFQIELDFGTQPWNSGLWLQISADGTDLSPRQPLTATPLALHADFASALDHAIQASEIDSGEIQLRIGSTCPAGQAVQSIDSSGGVTCETAGGSEWSRIGSSIFYNDGPVGIGTTDPGVPLAVAGAARFGNASNQASGGNSFVGGATRFRVLGNGGVAIGSSYQTDGVPERGMRVSGLAELASLGTGGSTSLCRNGDGAISTCGSSARYKHKIADLDGAGVLIEQLRPVSYRWAENGIEDFGLVAEEVAEIEPRLVIWSADGKIEGVKYQQLTAVLIGAMQEQARMRDQQLEALIVENDALMSRLERIESALGITRQTTSVE